MGVRKNQRFVPAPEVAPLGQICLGLCSSEVVNGKVFYQVEVVSEIYENTIEEVGTITVKENLLKVDLTVNKTELNFS